MIMRYWTDGDSEEDEKIRRAEERARQTLDKNLIHLLSILMLLAANNEC